MLRRDLEVEEWNKNHKVGEEVLLRLDGGEEVRTRTNSVARVLSGHTAVVWLEGFSGCWALGRVRGVV